MQNVHPLARFRESRGLSMEALGRLVGVNKVTIHRWEKGGRQPHVSLIPRLVEVTGIPAAVLRPDLARAMGRDE